tara:strand:+ start:223 stop:465 length:243 start_codon:yes stop_codon:yes gene_type:complete
MSINNILSYLTKPQYNILTNHLISRRNFTDNYLEIDPSYYGIYNANNCYVPDHEIFIIVSSIIKKIKYKAVIYEDLLEQN